MKRVSGIWYLKVAGEWMPVGSLHDAMLWAGSVSMWVR